MEVNVFVQFLIAALCVGLAAFFGYECGTFRVDWKYIPMKVSMELLQADETKTLVKEFYRNAYYRDWKSYTNNERELATKLLVYTLSRAEVEQFSNECKENR